MTYNHLYNLTSSSISSTLIPTPPVSIEAYDLCESFRFYVNVVVVSAISCFGVIGNTLSVIILQKERCHRTTRFLLQALAIADNLLLIMSFLILTIIDGTLHHFIQDPVTRGSFIHIAFKYLHPFAFMPLVATIWFTVLIAINRYIVVCHPLKASALCSLSKTRIQVVLISLMAICLNTPRFFQFDLVYDDKTGRIIGSRHTSIGTRTTFGIVYNNFMYNIVVLIVPVLVLMPLSFRLVLELKRMQKRREAMALLVYQAAPEITFNHYSNNDGSSDKVSNTSYIDLQPKRMNHQTKDENNITYVTVIIMVVLIICHTPDRALQIMKLSKARISGCNSGALYYFSLLCNIFVILNSSANFLVYYLLRRKFRHRLLVMLKLRKTTPYTNGNSTPIHVESSRTRNCSNQSLQRMHNHNVRNSISKHKSALHVNDEVLNGPLIKDIIERRNTS